MTKFFLAAYNSLFAVLLIPFFLIVLLFSGKYRKELFYRLPERFVKWKFPNRGSKKIVWLHCASLGEIRAAEPIIDDLRKDFFIVLTVVTKTGRQYAEKLNKADFISLLPLDLYPLMLKAIKKINPEILIIVETELWVSMLYAAKKLNVKVVTVNGRMSEKSFKMYKKMRFFWKRFVGLIDIVFARSQDDAERFKVLSGGKTEIIVTGNIKYDRDFSANADRKDFGLKDEDFVFTAGSVRDGEEEFIAQAYKKAAAKSGNIKFFLAPRHLTRIGKVKNILEKNEIKYSLLSELNGALLPGFKSSNFIVVDTFGKLQSIYSVSDVCYVGGSLVDKGGQNPVEPAAYSKPVLFGKHMDNFKTESEILLRYKGAFTVLNADDIAYEINRFASDKDFLAKAGGNALAAVKSQKGAVGVTIQNLRQQLKNEK
ncbi:3-deoxy-D-manno-octulosonic acid transferase [Endomicrobium proavitum]|uniref:3-deoxy-D-manno-octulosonic acid transferase n=1 Tax=Endomicrobium proavitum TaxID=1408281 RepID=A0A0G3WKA1_9BACT|nr:glycosyltransferase N-terminal domain-containing protein [Endomicrobium proavitum]AKL97924.1 three-deoxy-d-manno-octulosonic-acid transferase domain-containing protein [Endomicrobium proavitum]